MTVDHVDAAATLRCPHPFHRTHTIDSCTVHAQLQPAHNILDSGED
jgi:hypothetical protein